MKTAAAGDQRHFQSFTECLRRVMVKVKLSISREVLTFTGNKMGREKNLKRGFTCHHV